MFRDIGDTNDPDLQDIIDQRHRGHKLRAPSNELFIGRTRLLTPCSIPKTLKRIAFGILEVAIN